jgi:hypothetical protein
MLVLQLLCRINFCQDNGDHHVHGVFPSFDIGDQQLAFGLPIDTANNLTHFSSDCLFLVLCSSTPDFVKITTYHNSLPGKPQASWTL